MNTKPTVLVLGATGKVGGKVAQLLAESKDVRTQFKLNIEGRIPDADATFDNFEAITGRKSTSWWEFVEKHRQQLQY